jgi:hypothetical protein
VERGDVFGLETETQDASDSRSTSANISDSVVPSYLVGRSAWTIEDVLYGPYVVPMHFGDFATEFLG